jgi:hypothetical protein
VVAVPGPSNRGGFVRLLLTELSDAVEVLAGVLLGHARRESGD